MKITIEVPSQVLAEQAGLSKKRAIRFIDERREQIEREANRAVQAAMVKAARENARFNCILTIDPS